MSARTYADHMAWCKQRALEYVDAGDLAGALASLASDFRKHESTTGPTYEFLIVESGVPYVTSGDARGMRRFIEGFA